VLLVRLGLCFSTHLFSLLTASDRNRVLLFYLLSANLALFCNILKDPLHLESSHDVAILQDVPAMINKIPIRNLTPAEVTHLRFLNGFTTELARLATCAVLKAHRESHTSGDTCILGQ
jgi:hypothetical protein